MATGLGRLAVIAAVIVIVLVVGVYFYMGIPSQQDLDNEAFTGAMEGGGAEACMNITNQEQRTDCLRFFSLNNSDTRACMSMGEAEQIGCLFDLALQGNREACVQVPQELRDPCLVTLAQALNDTSVCEGVTDQALKTECIGRAGG